ncbi:SPOR domain-containing protein [Methylocaldum marinum]|nr:AAA family ATPase [Methylocaldum marinum]
MQKFDLLSHLAINLARPVVLCGPNSIGKTTFLRLLETRLAPLAAVCYIAAAPGMSYERILDGMRHVLNRNDPKTLPSSVDLTDLLETCAREHRNLVLLLDDAGALLPGFLDALWQLAGRHSALRLVLSMTSEEALQKPYTDRSAFGEAFLLEIPVLSEDECGLFAHQLRRASLGPITHLGENKAFFKKLYAGSRGIPGKVSEILESSSREPAKTESLAKVRWLTGAGILAGAAAYASFLIFSEQIQAPEESVSEGGLTISNRERTVIASRDREADLEVEFRDSTAPRTDSQSAVTSSSLSERETTKNQSTSESLAVSAVGSGSKDPVEDRKLAEAKVQSEPPGPSAREESRTVPAPRPQREALPNTSVQTDFVREATTKTAESENLTEPRNETPKTSDISMEGLKTAEWLMDQRPDAYTLQIVAVSRLSSVLGLAKQFPPGSELASFRSRKGNNDLYPLFFGIYPTLSAAKDAASALPVSLGRPLPRQMKSVHQEIRRMMPRHLELRSSNDSLVR